MLRHSLLRLPMEHLLMGQLPLLRDRQHGAVNMWTFLIEVYIKPYDVILTPLLTCKAVHIQCPLFDFRHTFDMGVVSLTIQVHILSAKGEFHHAVMVARKYDFRQRVARRRFLPLIGVFDAQFRKTFRHTFRNGLRFVDGLYLTLDNSDSYRTLTSIAVSSSSKGLVSGFYPSDQMFASGFLQIPSHGGHPCLWL